MLYLFLFLKKKVKKKMINVGFKESKIITMILIVFLKNILSNIVISRMGI